ncbi:40S ribosomal protein S5-1 [Hordeum vulgare]|nr:40S ribosomal protein S5-1 [Hordeum vulgare]
MMSPKALKDKIFEKLINPYLAGVLQHPQSIEMREGMLHIRDVEVPKKTGSVEARLEAMEQHVFKCQGMVEHGPNANHMMIKEFTNKQRIDANDIGKHLSRLYDRINHLQAQIYDLQNQNCATLAPSAHLATNDALIVDHLLLLILSIDRELGPFLLVGGKPSEPAQAPAAALLWQQSNSTALPQCTTPSITVAASSQPPALVQPRKARRQARATPEHHSCHHRVPC